MEQLNLLARYIHKEKSLGISSLEKVDIVVCHGFYFYLLFSKLRVL